MEKIFQKFGRKKEYSKEPNKDLSLEKQVDLDIFSLSFCKNHVGMLVKKGCMEKSPLWNFLLIII
jgi:hypothetical protein